MARLGTVVLIGVALCVGCAAAQPSSGLTGSIAPTATTSSGHVSASLEVPSAAPGSPISTAAAYSLGHFPTGPTNELPQGTAAALQAILDRAVVGLPGVSAAVVVAGQGKWSGAAGKADDKDPIEIDSKFGIASITKTVIGAEIMLLAEQGRLKLSDQLSLHLPADFSFDTNGATIANLLAMESGIPDPNLNANITSDPRRDWSAREVLATVPAFRSPPGDHFVYEDANYMLLGMVIAQVTGESVAQALRSGALADPSFAALVYQPDEKPADPLALPHIAGVLVGDSVALGGGYLPSEAAASSGNGSGCMASDSGTLALWAYQVFGGSILSQQSLQAMTDFSPGTTNGESGPYGM